LPAAPGVGVRGAGRSGWARGFPVAPGAARAEEPLAAFSPWRALGRTTRCCAMGAVAAAGGCDAAASGAGGADGAGKTAGTALAAGGADGVEGTDACPTAAGREDDVLHWCNFSTARARRKLANPATTKIARRETQASRGTCGRSALSPDVRLRSRKPPPVVQRPNRRAKAGNLVLPVWLGRGGSSSVVSSVTVSGTAGSGSSRGVGGAPDKGGRAGGGRR
jgi:hypothetical protein